MCWAKILNIGATGEQRKTKRLILLFILWKETHGGNICITFHLYNRRAVSWRKERAAEEGELVRFLFTRLHPSQPNPFLMPYHRSQASKEMWGPSRDAMRWRRKQQESRSHSAGSRKGFGREFASMDSWVAQPGAKSCPLLCGASHLAPECLCGLGQVAESLCAKGFKNLPSVQSMWTCVWYRNQVQ